MKKNLTTLCVMLFAISIFALIGCGGGGGGGNSNPGGAQTSSSKISESVAAQKFVARQLSVNFADLETRKNANLRAATTTTIEPGKQRIVFGPRDEITLLGLVYTYTSGSQTIVTRDINGNLTDNDGLIDSIEIISENVVCSIKDGDDIVSGTLNGKIKFSGFYEETNFSVVAQNNVFSGTINGLEQFTWTSNTNVSINQSSFPYPVSGSNESGTVLLNGNSYTYSISYSGLKVVNVAFSGSESFELRINLETGSVVEVITPVTSDGPSLPEDMAFQVPNGFSSAAFPKYGPTAKITLNGFGATSEAWLFCMNYSSFVQQVGYDISGPTFAASQRASEIDSSESPMTAGQLLQWQLREKARQMVPPTQAADQSARGSVRAAERVGSTDTFKAFIAGSTAAQTVNATCRRSDEISGTTKKIHFFVDNADLGMANLDTLLSNLSSAWTSIYVKNREIFGEEPTGLLTNGVNATDFYILLSRKIYTAGYFYTGDLNSISQTSDSNQKKMFNLQLPAGITTTGGLNNIDVVSTELSATMAHEFQHMIHYWVRGNISDTWLEEAMSGYAEYINGYSIEAGKNQSKALQSNSYFSRVSTISFNKWHASSDSNEVVNAYYGKAYLFGVWLAKNFGNNGSVRSLLNRKVSDEAAIAAFTGLPIEEVFAKFMMALAVNDHINGGAYGIKGLDLKKTYAFGSSLAPITLTGPLTINVNASSGVVSNVSVAPYGSAYIKIGTGDGSNLNISADLPTYTAMFQIRKIE